MATKGKIQVVSANKDGTFTVQAVGAGSAQLMSKARGRVDGLEIKAAWPRRRGGADFPDLRLAKG